MNDKPTIVDRILNAIENLGNPGNQTPDGKPTNVELSADQLMMIMEQASIPRNSPLTSHLGYGTFFGNFKAMNLLDANIGSLPLGRNPDELKLVQAALYGQMIGCDARHDFRLDNVATKILSGETSFNLEDYTLQTTTGGARRAISDVLRHLTATGKRNVVAYATPNWAAFDHLVKTVPGAQSSAMHVETADQFVQKFSDLPNKEKVAAIIVVDPANPLGYRLTETHVAELERIADKYGVAVVFDDVFRGMQVLGQRHSASEYSKNAIVIESTSKRFGERSLGVTWTLFPQGVDIKLTDSTDECRGGCKETAAAVVDGLYRLGYGERISEMVRQNGDAFVAGFNMIAEELLPLQRGSFYRAFPATSIITYQFPIMPISSQDFVDGLADRVQLTSGFEWVSDVRSRHKTLSIEEVRCANSYMRICPTKETPDRCFLAGAFCSHFLSELLTKTKG